MISRMWRPLVAGLYRRVGWSRARLLVRQIAPHLAGKMLLDLGAGTGHTAVLLHRKYGQCVVMLDVTPHRGAWGQRLVGQPIAAHLSKRFGLARVRYDGRHIPFKDGAFDTVLIAFVLHHCEHQDEVLREAARVSKGRVLVLEDGGDTPPTRADGRWDALFNLEFFHPHHERSRGEWRALFGECGLKIVEETSWEWPLGFLRVSQTLFVLDKEQTD